MNESLVQTIGIIAGTLTTLAFLPQVIKTWRSRSVADISLAWACSMVVGIFCWLVYGLMLGEMPIIVANLASLTLALMMLAMKLRFSRK
ncbi:MAG: hypothetical protein A2600_13120 [Candidatus Lambdaproteobacteria bacterium RIFOXYD1_FULL_56_27]|uniref:Glutathione synthetase n=1 Tax=Candidatus Lambdaproteobacteria bacterium RIFOXYD2_FULL_56_26 TaxID=1817773 RepID=A0A1F6GZM9_9PROT|nr:MAG: hypothetical protein A2426_06165 [Candidatus Lambdaproteobacteria bacterium RIFOXYC1_FULL_56_13]OGH03626.1 MAG: hypothetical protein A2557_13935 [Candidatus Lambdaproteobacteria bacterium RIFOXYD2_FULL_56_26]OGH06557.1 MAG: hypothetical protein A2600_13120 [Candidatus Lambdaproteobacteria bacterium RIFOXYD1_FULL_56_27]